MTRPPRLPRALLRRALPAAVRREVLGDLDAEYAEHVAPARGRTAARAWYWRQAIASLPHAVAMRRRARLGAAGDRRALATLADNTARDVALAFRSLRARRGFAAGAIVTLTLGIGANAALFSVADAVLLKPLPYREPARLLRVWSSNPRGIPRNSVSPADFFDLRDQGVAAGAFESLSAFTAGDAATLQGPVEAARITTSTVSTDLFGTLGVRAARGRGFVPADAAGRPAVAVLAEPMARSLFGAPELAPGAAVTIDGDPFTVVGVMPASFAFPSPAVEAWIPLPDSSRGRSRSAHFLDVVGRLAPGVDRPTALAALEVAAQRLADAYPDTNRGWGITATTLRDAAVGTVRLPLLILLGAVACVLLIACANLAALLLARTADRARELAVRAALGASAARVVRQHLSEAAVLGACGGLGGLALAWAGIRLLRSAAGLDLPLAERIALAGRGVAAAAAMSLATGMLAGALPAWRAARIDLDGVLKGSRTAGASLPARRARSVLVSAEIALTIVLAIGAGLLVRSLWTLTRVDAGVNADRVLLATVSLAGNAYEPQRWAAYVERALGELAAIPGARHVGGGSPLPLSGRQGLLRFGVRVEDRPAPSADNRADRAYLRWATPGYFQAIGIPLRAGRGFEPRDRTDAPAVAVVDETFVARYLPGEDPVGRRIRMSNERQPREIVGVVGAVRQTALDEAAEPHVYVPQSQNASPVMTFVLRSDGDPRGLAPAVRDRLRALDPGRPVYGIRTLDHLVAGSVAGRRFQAGLLAIFAVLAGTLTLVGVYGLVAYWIGESRKEIGVRLALGATPRSLLAGLVGRTLRVAVPGAAAGCLLALAGARLASGLLYGVAPADPLTFAAATLLVLAAAVVATCLPARRVLAIDPSDALRAE